MGLLCYHFSLHFNVLKFEYKCEQQQCQIDVRRDCVDVLNVVYISAALNVGFGEGKVTANSS